MDNLTNIVTDAKRIVIKIGSSSLSHASGKLNFHRIELLSRTLSDFVNSGKQIILVSSGAITAGRSKLNYGQAELMRIYERFFSSYGQNVAQVLITREIVDNAECRQNAKNTFEVLMNLGCVPIVNENDTVSFEEIEFGDNDTLAAHVAVLCGADLLINLSDIDGLYDSDPHMNPDAHLISSVSEITDEIRSCAGGAGSDFGTGGVVTKIHAAEISTDAGIPMLLLNGENPELLYELLAGKHIGTIFYSKSK